MARPLIERDAEQRELERLLAAAGEGSGRVLVLTGPAGIGKTALLRLAVDGAPARGLRALVAWASDLERDLPFGVARQLLEGPVRAADEEERARWLGGPAHRASTVLGVAGDEPGDTEPSAAAHALFWLVSALAEEGPLLLAVDDVQWSDEPSLRALAYLARRLAGLPVAILATLRAGDPVAGALAALLAEPATTVVRPEPLQAAGVARLLAARFGQAADPAFAAVCRARTGGNPFLLDELAAGLVARGVPPDEAAVPEVEAAVPERVSLAVGRRFAALGSDARALARAVVVLGDGAEPGVAAALAELDPHAGAQAAERLAAADLVDGGPRLGFRHPLVRAAVSATVGDAARGRDHARAARLLAERGAPPAVVAAHLVAAPAGGGDPWAVEQLRRAARAVRRQGAPEHAIPPLRRALAEPAPPPVRPALLHELGRAELAAMDPDAAGHLEAALDLRREHGERAEVALELATAHYTVGDHTAAVEVLLHAIGELGAEQREHRLRLEAFLAIAGRYDMATEGAVRGRVHALAHELRGATPGERLVLAAAAVERPGPRADGLARAAWLQERVMGDVPWPDPSEGIGTVAMYLHAGRPDRARLLADALLDQARRAGSPARHAVALFCRGSVQLDVGALEEAETDMRDALADGTMLRPTARAAGVGQLALVLAERGAAAEAQALLAAHGLEGELPEHMVLNPLLHARAVVRLAQGRWAEAAADARELGRRHAHWDLRRPSPNWRAVAAEALRAGGEPGAARELAEASLPLARAWGTPKAIAIALRAHAVTADPDTAHAELEEALAGLRDTPWRLETARVQVELGALLRRSGARRSAREHLGEGMDRAHRCGARALAGRAAEELGATGARPRRHAQTGRDALTASERRVAALAAAGRSNREIAQELFITVATVETHLRRVYRKLGVDGRPGLAAMGQASPGAAPDP